MMIFLTTEIDQGFTWSITSKLGHILATAEEKYGLRDESYTILGVEIIDAAQPQIWYPGGKKHVAIRLTKSCLDNLNQAVFQLSHEVIHCLSPSGGQHANYLEEGLATHFSVDYSFSNGHGAWNPELPKYVEAMRLVRELLKIDNYVIKKIRAIQPAFYLVTVNDITKANDNVPQELAAALVRKF